MQIRHSGLNSVFILLMAGNRHSLETLSKRHCKASGRNPGKDPYSSAGGETDENGQRSGYHGWQGLLGKRRQDYPSISSLPANVRGFDRRDHLRYLIKTKAEMGFSDWFTPAGANIPLGFCLTNPLLQPLGNCSL